MPTCTMTLVGTDANGHVGSIREYTGIDPDTGYGKFMWAEVHNPSKLAEDMASKEVTYMSIFMNVVKL